MNTKTTTTVKYSVQVTSESGTLAQYGSWDTEAEARADLELDEDGWYSDPNSTSTIIRRTYTRTSTRLVEELS